MPTQVADPPAVVVKAVPRAAQKKLDELLRLRSQTGLNWYQRAKLAAELLADRGFLEAQCDGDEGRACDFLTGFAFDDLPEDVWLANKCDPRKVEDAWLALRRPEAQPRGTRHVVSKKQLEEAVERAATATPFALRRTSGQQTRTVRSSSALGPWRKTQNTSRRSSNR